MSDPIKGGVKEEVKRIKSPTAKRLVEQLLRDKKFRKRMRKQWLLSLPTFRIIYIPRAFPKKAKPISFGQYYIFMIYPITSGIDQKELSRFINQKWKMVESVKLHLTGGKRKYGKRTTSDLLL